MPRRPLLGPDNLGAEGRPSKKQTCLGWDIDTRRLQICLPNNKYKEWNKDLVEVIEHGEATTSGLESLTGMLNYMSFVISLSRHLLVEICRQVDLNKRRSKVFVRLSLNEIEDLRLWEFWQNRMKV